MKLCEWISLLIKQSNYKVFGLPGYAIMPIWDAIGKENDIILSRHESGAVFMADGYTRKTGKLSVVLGTVGPGQTNMTTGVACAYKDSIPLLIVTGQNNSSRFGKGEFQESCGLDRSFQPSKLFDGITKMSMEITSIDNATFIFEKAIQLATEGRPGPVHISVPFDLQNAIICEKTVEKHNDSKIATGFYDELHLQKVADIINRAERPLVLVGWGAYLCRASTQIKTFAERLSCPIISTIKGLAAVSSTWAWYIGHIGNGYCFVTKNFLKDYKPDLLICLGTSLSSYYMDSVTELFKETIICQVDIDSSQIGLHYDVDIGFVADVSIWLNNVLQKIKNKDLCLDSIADVNKKYIQYTSETANVHRGLFSESINLLNSILPEDAIVIPDAGNHWLNTLSLYRTKNVDGFMTNAGLGAMGHAIGCSIGISLADKSRPVVCITGDGSALMSGTEISVSSEQNCPIIFIIYNDSSLGRVRCYQVANSTKTTTSDLPKINFQNIGCGLGAQSISVNSIEQFYTAMKNALESRDTWVIEVIISKHDIPVFLNGKMGR